MDYSGKQCADYSAALPLAAAGIPNAMLSIWLYLTLGVYQTEMNVARNAIAILLGYTAFHWIKERKFAPYFCKF